jgi:hypothetical protein
MSVVTQLYFKILEENSYMFRPFFGCAIIRLRLEYRRKLIYCNVDIKNGGTRSCFTYNLKNQLHVSALSGWAIIRLRLEYRRKLIYCNVDIKNGGTRSRFTMFNFPHLIIG